MSIFPQWLINLCDQAQSHVPKQYMLMIWNCRNSVCCNSVFNAKKKTPKTTENVFIIIIVLLMSINISRLQCNCYPVY